MDGPEPRRYYLRIYPNGRVAQWPSPPDDGTAWTRLKGEEVEFGYRPPLSNPHLNIRGANLIMSGSSPEVTGCSFSRIVPDLEPPTEPEQAAQ